MSCLRHKEKGITGSETEIRQLLPLDETFVQKNRAVQCVQPDDRTPYQTCQQRLEL